MPNPPRACIFCESPGLIREHIWADWLRPYLTQIRSAHGVETRTYYPDFTAVRQIKKRSGDPRQRRVRSVCHKCNNEWMSVLQSECKPILLTLIENRPITLYRRHQRLLCAWCTMLVAVAEWQDRDYVAISPVDRSWFYERKVPPGHWRIWIASYPNGFPEQYCHYVLQLVDNVEEVHSFEPNTQTTTFRVGHLLFHVMSSASRFGRRAIRNWRWRTPIAAKIAPLWPIRGDISWPLRDLTDSEARLFADEFFAWWGDISL